MSLMKISFYIPTRNSQETIEKCLESVLSQSLKPHEIFIIEGSSKDSTISIIKKIAKKKLSIPINIITQKSIGLANARNLAISNANFEIIASCDSDVVLGKEWLKNIIKPLYDSKIVGVGGHMSEKISSKYDKWRPIHMKQNWGNKKIKNPRFLFGSNTVFKKIVFKKIKYNPNLTSNFEDVDISIKIKNKGYTIFYEPKAKCTHIKSDTFKSLLKTYYNWTFYGYPKPNNLLNLALKLFIFNVSKSTKLIIKDIFNLRFGFILLDIAIYFHNSLKDVQFFMKNG